MGFKTLWEREGSKWRHLQDWRNRLLKGTDRTLCVPEPRRKERWPHKRLTRLASDCPGVPGRGVGQQWPAAGLGALSVAVHAWDLLKEVPLSLTIIFITSTTVCPQVNKREETQFHPLTENWIKDLLSMAPPIRIRLLSPSACLSHQEASISLLPFSIRGQKDWKPQSQKTNHKDRSLV